jgi:hypothetical protein
VVLERRAHEIEDIQAEEKEDDAPGRRDEEEGDEPPPLTLEDQRRHQHSTSDVEGPAVSEQEEEGLADHDGDRDVRCGITAELAVQLVKQIHDVPSKRLFMRGRYTRRKIKSGHDTEEPENGHEAS